MAMAKTNTFMHTVLTTNCYMDASPGIKYDYLYVDSSVPQRDPAIYRNETALYVNTDQLNKIIADSSYMYTQTWRIKDSGIDQN